MVAASRTLFSGHRQFTLQELHLAGEAVLLMYEAHTAYDLNERKRVKVNKTVTITTTVTVRVTVFYKCNLIRNYDGCNDAQ